MRTATALAAAWRWRADRLCGAAAPLALGEPIRVQSAAFKAARCPATPRAPAGRRRPAARASRRSRRSAALAFPGQVGQGALGSDVDRRGGGRRPHRGRRHGYWLQPLGAADLLERAAS